VCAFRHLSVCFARHAAGVALFQGARGLARPAAAAPLCDGSVHGGNGSRAAGRVHVRTCTLAVCLLSLSRRLKPVWCPPHRSDALYPANSEAPLRPPPKWKVCAITIASLFLVVYPVSLHVPDLLSKCGIKNTYGQIPITSAINVFLNTYTMNPLLMTVVGHWLAQPRPPFTDAQPWKLLDQGFGTSHCALALRFLLVFAYFVPLLASWAVNR